MAGEGLVPVDEANSLGQGNRGNKSVRARMFKGFPLALVAVGMLAAVQFQLRSKALAIRSATSSRLRHMRGWSSAPAFLLGNDRYDLLFREPRLPHRPSPL